MTVIKQTQIPTGTLKLKKLKNDTNLSDNRFKYVVEFPDGDRTGLSFTKQEGMRQFKRVANLRKTGAGGASSSGGSGGFLDNFL